MEESLLSVNYCSLSFWRSSFFHLYSVPVYSSDDKGNLESRSSLVPGFSLLILTAKQTFLPEIHKVFIKKVGYFSLWPHKR